MTKELLRRLPLFSKLTEADLDLIYDMAKPVAVRAREVLLTEGSVGDAMYVVLDGEFEVTKNSGQQDIVLSVRRTGDVIGEMSLLVQEPRMASVRALRDSEVLKISERAFEQLLACSPSAGLALLQTVASRLRSTEALVAQNEKMASLGTMAAGLAHELNNPAAAAWRSADQLREVLAKWQRLSVELDVLTFNPEQVEKLTALRDELQNCTATVALEPLAQSDQEAALQEWLEGRGIDEAWELAPTLLSYGWGPDEMEELAESFSGEQLSVVVPWLAAGCSANALLDEIEKSAQSISELVKAVKTYSYLDQAPIQRVNLHEGLDNTLVILKHKLKGGVRVTRDYAPDLPPIEAYASELNQVWTNIIDNAIDAMQGKGEITLRTYGKDGIVVVEITDNGPGIPADVQPRIFEPFYTTKGPGVGTGLGLHIAYNIVADKHHGRIQVTSRPGETRFQITLPVNLARE